LSNKGELLVKIKPDCLFVGGGQPGQSQLLPPPASGEDTVAPNVEKAERDTNAIWTLFNRKVACGIGFIAFKGLATWPVPSLTSRPQQVEHGKGKVGGIQKERTRTTNGEDRRSGNWPKTTIFSPVDGTVTKMNSQSGRTSHRNGANADRNMIISE